MNQKTAKLLRKYSRFARQNLKDLKRVWNRMPRWLRHEARGAIKADIL